MIAVLFFIFSLSVLAFILLADHVKNRFHHTEASRRVLLVELAVSVLVAVAGSLELWPSRSLLVRVGTAVPAALFLFVLMAFITVEVWRFRKQGGFDREISRLLRERNHFQEMLDRLTWELNDLERQRADRESQTQQFEGRHRALEDQLLAWEHAGDGSLRRSVLIEQWLAELHALPGEELAARREEALWRMSQSKVEERDELAARITLIDLVSLRRALSGPGGPLAEVEQRLHQLRDARARAERRLDQIKQELRDWQERKTAFLREKIRLD